MSANLAQSDALLEHIDSLSTSIRKRSELAAFEQLKSKYPKSIIIKALTHVKLSGLPPYGKLTNDPLADLASNSSVMDLFMSLEPIETHQTTKDDRVGSAVPLKESL